MLMLLFKVLKGSEATLKESRWEPMQKTYDIGKIICTITFFQVMQNWPKRHIQKLRFESCFLFEILHHRLCLFFDFAQHLFNLLCEDMFRVHLS